MTRGRSGAGAGLRRGMALVLVTVAMASAAVMAYAMLASASLQAQVGANGAAAAQADYLAESGLNIAAYYLQFPDRAPTVTNEGYFPGGTFTLGSAVPGLIQVTVAPLNFDVYEVTSTASVINAGGALRHTSRARLEVLRVPYKSSGVATFSGNTNIPSFMSIRGDIYSPGWVYWLGSLLEGNVYAAGATGLPLGVSLVPTAVEPPPTALEINTYDTYRYQGSRYTAARLNTSTLSQVTLGPTASNPAGVYISDGELHLGGAAVINGTLVVHGRLSVRGANNTITPAAGFPAAIIDQDIQMYQASKTLVINGLCWTGLGLTQYGNSASCRLTINGALLMGPNAAFSSSYRGDLTLNSRPELSGVADLSRTQPVQSVRMLSWNP